MKLQNFKNFFFSEKRLNYHDMKFQRKYGMQKAHKFNFYGIKILQSLNYKNLKFVI